MQPMKMMNNILKRGVAGGFRLQPNSNNINCRIIGGSVSAKNMATITYSKAGAPSQVVNIGPDVDVKSLGDSEVAVKFLAAAVNPVDLQASFLTSECPI